LKKAQRGLLAATFVGDLAASSCAKFFFHDSLCFLWLSLLVALAVFTLSSVAAQRKRWPFSRRDRFEGVD
jgi:hypothetical protein